MGVQKIGQMELEARMLTFWGIKGQEMGFGGTGCSCFSVFSFFVVSLPFPILPMARCGAHPPTLGLGFRFRLSGRI